MDRSISYFDYALGMAATGIVVGLHSGDWNYLIAVPFIAATMVAFRALFRWAARGG